MHQLYCSCARIEPCRNNAAGAIDRWFSRERGGRTSECSAYHGVLVTACHAMAGRAGERTQRSAAQYDRIIFLENVLNDTRSALQSTGLPDSVWDHAREIEVPSEAAVHAMMVENVRLGYPPPLQYHERLRAYGVGGYKGHTHPAKLVLSHRPEMHSALLLRRVWQLQPALFDQYAEGKRERTVMISRGSKFHARGTIRQQCHGQICLPPITEAERQLLMKLLHERHSRVGGHEASANRLRVLCI